ncbi:MAG: 6-phosphofructokinase [Candidatus Buchananbacteria bacterium]
MENHSDIQHIGIITSGGDAGGLNGVIKGAVTMAHALGIKVSVIPNGYAGLYNLLDFGELTVLSPERVDLIDACLAGSEAGHSRVSIKKIQDEGKYEHIKAGLQKHGLDALIISGGDDTGSVMVDLTKHGIRCVHAPKTMDLDLQTYSVGADSTINRIARFLADLKTTARTHNRCFVVEVFGRNAGHTALRGGIAGDADCILIPEIPVDFGLVYADMKRKLFRRIAQSDVKAGSYSIVMAEGVTDAHGEEFTDGSAGVDAFGHKKLNGAGKYAAKALQTLLNQDPEVKDLMQREHMFVPGIYEAPEVRDILPSHLVRCGDSSALDVNFGREVGGAAVILLVNGHSNVTVVDVRDDGLIRYLNTEKAIQQRGVSLEMVSFYEAQGICFGRKVVPCTMSCSSILPEEYIQRVY